MAVAVQVSAQEVGLELQLLEVVEALQLAAVLALDMAQEDKVALDMVLDLALEPHNLVAEEVLLRDPAAVQE